MKDNKEGEKGGLSDLTAEKKTNEIKSGSPAKETRRSTVQKTLIMRTLREMNCHASAGMVYEEIHKNYPDISRATVFRVLANAAEDGDLLRLKLAEADDRFDITTHPHCHITCRRCGYVCDIETPDDLPRRLVGLVDDAGGFRVEKYHLELMGVCPDCAAKEAASDEQSAETGD